LPFRAKIKGKIMKAETKARKNQIKITGSLLVTIVLILFFALPVFCQDSPYAPSIAQLERELNQHRFSGFQQRMILTTAQSLFESGINTIELNKLLTASIANNFDAYNIKKILEILIDAKQNGVSEESLLNKFKEGLSKQVDERLIVQVMHNELENLKIARNIYADYTAKETDYDSLLYDEDIIVESLAESLNNGVPKESLSEVLTRSAQQGRSLQEVTEVSTELGNLSLRAFEIGFTEEEIGDVFQKAVLSRSGVDGICEDIQEMLVAAVVSKMNMASRNNSTDGTNPDDEYSTSDLKELSTIVILSGFKEKYRSVCPIGLEVLAYRIVEHCLLYFLSEGSSL